MQTESKEIFLTKESLKIELWNMLSDECRKIIGPAKESYIQSIMADIDSYCDGKNQPVEQTVDAGQLEKIIGDAFDAGYDFAESGFVSNGPDDIILSDKDQYIKQAIELINNSKTQNHE